MSVTHDFDVEKVKASKLKFPRSVKWSSEKLLWGITGEHVTAPSELRKSVHHDLWGDMCAEHDSQNLWFHLNNLPYNFSEQFKQALEVWRLDEINHYIGLRQICSTMYHVSEQEIDDQMKNRIPDFHNLAPFLTDEFKICVVLAYDELVSARGYTIFTDDFKKFGPEPYVQWVKWAARDEALHYYNFIDVAKNCHPDRLIESKKIINEIKKYENQKNYEYKATFLLDHTEETFSREFLNSCGKMVLSALNSQ